MNHLFEKRQNLNGIWLVSGRYPSADSLLDSAGAGTSYLTWDRTNPQMALFTTRSNQPIGGNGRCWLMTASSALTGTKREGPIAALAGKIARCARLHSDSGIFR